jgi:LysR family hydrogen peroxide-inducible transcriptional activator
MTLTELRYLVALAQEQHFGRAAELCCVSQPTLSMAIRKLEENLEVLLFERSKSGIRATSMGEQIIAQAQRIVAQADVITALAEADKDQLGGELKLGAILSLGPYLLPQLIPQLRLIAKSLRLDLYEGYTEDLRSKLRTGELDAILVSQPFSEQDVVTQDIYDEPLLLVMPPMHSLAAKSQISASDLNGQTFIVLKDGHCLREQMLEIFPQLQGNTAANIIESSSLETLRHMVAIGLGVSILPSSAAISSAYAAHALTARPLQSAPTRKIALAWRASFPRHKAIDAVRRAIQTCSWQFTTAHNTNSQGLLVENRSW